MQKASSSGQFSKTVNSTFKIHSSLIEGLFQVSGESLKLKQLKLLIDGHSSSVFSNFASKRDALAYLKQKVWLLS